MNFPLKGQQLSVGIILVTEALCALFLAQCSSTLLASKVLPVEPVASVATQGGKSTERPPGSDLPDIHKILERNIFDPTTGALWPPKPTEVPVSELPDESEPQVLQPGEIPPACDGSLKMVAAVYSEGKPEWSFASMTSGSEAPMLYRQGSQIADKQIETIYPKAVFLRTANKRLCSVMLFTQPPPAESVAQAQPTVTPPPPSGAPSSPILGAASSISEAELDSNIKSSGETKFSVQRSFVDKILQNQGEIMRSARIVPHEENGQVVGVKMYGIRRNSLLGKLGLQNGDLLRTINGFEMSSPDTALEAYAKLRTANNLSVAIVRRGRNVNVDYDITQ